MTPNPIIPGYAPDPSLVKVKDWYYLVNSTFQMFPGLPIYASQDLESWKHIGNAIHRPGQLSLAKSDTRINPLPKTGEVMLVTGGLYAPTIRYHEGTFYVVCTNIVHPGGDEDISENFIVSTTDIWGGEWSDPVYFDFKGIDPSLLFDDDGKVYLQGSAAPGPMTKINLFEIDLKTGKKLSEERTLWEGTGGIYPEGPHIYKRNGWYYLLISEGGTNEDHMLTMARSRDIWGPYEPHPENPILTARGTDEYIQFTGHCEAFQDGEGRWWGVCLGVRRDPGGRYVMGRESFLTRGNWDGEWLSLDIVKSEIDNPNAKGVSAGISAVRDVDYLYIRDPDLNNYEIRGDDYSEVVLAASPVDLSHPETSPTFIGKRQRAHLGKSSVTLRPQSWSSSGLTSGADKLRGGIASYKDEHRYVRVFYDASDNSVVFEVLNKANGIYKTEARSLESAPESIHLRIEYTEQEYRVLYSTGSAPEGDDSWICLGVVDTMDMTNPDFVGPVIGVYAVADSGNQKVTFHNLRID
ncbi:probable xylosidase/arabinosidase [Cephalotrichum gorgonifer]|uniref:Probable xylosidase/arabinosidase n=1 Tax=Cephalotrichum gorgonifer TaxID=2041049 RepID=A0AAE8MYL9_9PEZI|nr:probable xylosidase/arabinosidase [Cephalotrichum gorgonifer]